MKKVWCRKAFLTICPVLTMDKDSFHYPLFMNQVRLFIIVISLVLSGWLLAAFFTEMDHPEDEVNVPTAQ